MKYVAIFTLIFIILTGCQSTWPYYSSDLTEAEKQQIKQEVTELLYATFESIKTDGYPAELNYLDNSPDFFWIPPGRSIPIRYDSVGSILKAFTKGYRSAENTWDTLYVQPITRETASYAGRFHSVYVDTAGNVSPRYNMMEIGVAVKRKSGWKIFSGQTSSVPKGK